MKVTVIEHEYKLDSIPFVEDEMAIIDGEDMVMFAHHYCIVGACFSGAHFISETFDSYELDSIPFVEDEMAIIDGEDMVMFAHHYCIVGACFSGAHFISETFDSYEDAADVFAKYCATVRYFDGGTMAALALFMSALLTIVKSLTMFGLHKNLQNSMTRIQHLLRV